MIDNLAIKGGGVKGVAYVGAIRELEKINFLSGIKRVAGTSAGALMACMICAGYDITAIEKLMLSINFKKFETGWNPLRMFTHYGLYSGKYIISFVQDLLKNSPKGLLPDASFADMEKAGCKGLYVFSCNTNLHTITEFSADKTPHVLVAEAVRASMSIPFFFKAWQFSNGHPDNHVYVDGGVVYNYPLSFFDDARFDTGQNVNVNSIGLYLYSKTRQRGVPLHFNMPMFFSKQLFESLLATQDFIEMEDKEQMQRSILIDDLGIPATDFNITREQMNALIESGSKAATDYITQHPQT